MNECDFLENLTLYVNFSLCFFMLMMIWFVLYSFGLFEGMSAIEMMDPKMDAGMMCNQTKRKVLNLQQSIEVCPFVFVFSVMELRAAITRVVKELYSFFRDGYPIGTPKTVPVKAILDVYLQMVCVI